MALKTLIGERIMQDVIRQVQTESQWKILVLDRLSTRIISSCCKMKDIIDEGITLVEDLMKVRQPLTAFDVVYFVTPTKNSVDCIIDDFAVSRKYRFVHLFFTDSCPDNIFRAIGQNTVAKYIKTIKEVNIAFLPYESQVFTLDYPESFEYIYSPEYASSRNVIFERIAEQLSTLCAVLGEYPSIRYRQEGDKSLLLAQLLQTKLDAFKAVNPSMGDGPDKSRSQLIIFDRGFDLTSMFLHELTYQAMVQDLLQVENDVYKYETQQDGNREKQVLLDEDDDLWILFRHEHIADVSNRVTSRLKTFAKEKRLGSAEKTTMRDLANMVKKMPQYQKELSKYTTHLRMAEDCMKHYSERVDKLCKTEQDLAMGIDAAGNHIKEPMRNTVQALLDETFPVYDKLRIMLLYVLLKNGLVVADAAYFTYNLAAASDFELKGLTVDNVDKLIQHSKLPKSECVAIDNLQLLGVNVYSDGANFKKRGPKFERKDRTAKYQASRWTPAVKDLMEYAIDDKLDQRLFPFLTGRGSGSAATSARSARYQWHKDKGPGEYKSGPRLFIFIIGGMSCSEMRCAYEVTNDLRAKGNKWEVLIGSSHIWLPEQFLRALRSLSKDGVPRVVQKQEDSSFSVAEEIKPVRTKGVGATLSAISEKLTSVESASNAAQFVRQMRSGTRFSSSTDMKSQTTESQRKSGEFRTGSSQKDISGTSSGKFDERGLAAKISSLSQKVPRIDSTSSATQFAKQLRSNVTKKMQRSLIN